MTPKELREATYKAVLGEMRHPECCFRGEVCSVGTWCACARDIADAALAAIRAREDEVGRLREALVRLCAWGRMTPSTPDERSAEQREGWGAFDQARAALATPAPEDAA